VAQECPFCRENCNCKACLRSCGPKRVGGLQHPGMLCSVLCFYLLMKLYNNGVIWCVTGNCEVEQEGDS
jgi:hypothetical protein